MKKKKSNPLIKALAVSVGMSAAVLLMVVTLVGIESLVRAVVYSWVWSR